MAGQRIWSTRWLRLAMLAVMMLATIGAWEVFRGAAKFAGYAHADGLLDHFTCYEVKVDRSDRKSKDSKYTPKIEVQVTDQFNAPYGVEVEVKQLKLLCAPANKRHLY